MFDILRDKLNRELLKYSAGRAIFCPHCGRIADYRRWAIAESPTGANIWNGCVDCFKKINDEIIDKNWSVTMMPQKQKKPVKLPDTITVYDRTQKESVTIPCVKAFRMYDNDFVAHYVINSDVYWTVTHVNSGAAVCRQNQYKSKTAAIRMAKYNLENAGFEGFNRAIESLKEIKSNNPVQDGYPNPYL